MIEDSMSHTSIEIYVRSSPLGSKGIHWRNISKDGQPPEEPEMLKSRIILKDNGKKATINSLINDTKPSVVLARYDDKILLEITGLEASEVRSSQLGRRITEVVLWIGDASPEVELQLRKLSACAMLGLWDKSSAFLKTIRDAIRFKDLNDFQVDQPAIKQLYAQTGTYLETFSPTPSEQGTSSVWAASETINSDNHLRSLAHQIIQSPLPESEQPVIIIAEIKNNCLEYRGNIWKAPIQPIKPPVPLQKELGSKSEKKNSWTQPETTPPPTNRIVILGVILAIAILVIALTSLQLKPPMKMAPVLTAPPKPDPTATVTPKPAILPTSKTQTTLPKPTPTPIVPQPTALSTSKSQIKPFKSAPTASTTPKTIRSPKATQPVTGVQESDLQSPKLSQD
jgi:hypothetical protein